MPAEKESSGQRILPWPTRVAVAFIICFLAAVSGIAIYLSHGGGSEYEELLPMAVMFFPMGITVFLPGNLEPVVGLMYGWAFYVAVLVALLRNDSPKVFTAVASGLVAVLVLNLYGCTQLYVR